MRARSPAELKDWMNNREVTQECLDFIDHLICRNWIVYEDVAFARIPKEELGQYKNVDFSLLYREAGWFITIGGYGDDEFWQFEAR